MMEVNGIEVRRCTLLTDAYGADTGLATKTHPIWFLADPGRAMLAHKRKRAAWYSAQVLLCPLDPNKKCISINENDKHFPTPTDHDKIPDALWAAIAFYTLTN
jgi:hypothetical protein